jgi:hypothetical protein
MPRPYHLRMPVLSWLSRQRRGPAVRAAARRNSCLAVNIQVPGLAAALGDGSMSRTVLSPRASLMYGLVRGSPIPIEHKQCAYARQ